MPNDLLLYEMTLTLTIFSLQALLLPVVVDTLNLSQENCTSFSNICGHLSVSPEQLEEKAPVLDVLRKGEDELRMCSRSNKNAQ